MKRKRATRLVVGCLFLAGCSVPGHYNVKALNGFPEASLTYPGSSHITRTHTDGTTKLILRRPDPNRAQLRPGPAMRTALAFVRSGPARTVMAEVHRRVDKDTGERRQLDVDVVVAGTLAASAVNKAPQATEVLHFLKSLPYSMQVQHNIVSSRRDKIGLPYDQRVCSYRQVKYLLDMVGTVTDPDGTHTDHDHPDVNVITGEVFDCDPGCPSRFDVNTLNDALADAAWEVLELPDCDTWAVDSTLLESHYRRFGRGTAADVDFDSVEARTAAHAAGQTDAFQVTAAYVHVPEGERVKPWSEPDDTVTGQARRGAAEDIADNRRRNRSKKITAGGGKALSRQQARTRATEEYQRWADANPTPKPRKGTRKDPRTVPAGPTATGDVRSYHPAFPAIGPDGRMVPTKSPWARDGFQSGVNNSPKQILAGGDLHVLTASGHAPDGRPLPPFARRFRFMPAGENKGRPVVDAVLGAITDGVTVTDLQADRGMTILDPENFARPLHHAHVNVHKDLHPMQRGLQGWHHGALMLDGWFFSGAMPEHQWELPGTTMNSTRTEREAVHRAHDKRLREWGYLSLGPAQADGSQRLQGPARHLVKRCPNYGPSWRLSPSKYDETGCTPGEDCGCGRTITVTADLQERMRQPHVWMTTPWAAAYYRRNLVESYNSWVEYHRNLRRGALRVVTLGRSRSYLGLWLVGSLIAQARNWRQAEKQPQPAVLHDDPGSDHDHTLCDAHSSQHDASRPARGAPPPSRGAPRRRPGRSRRRP